RIQHRAGIAGAHMQNEIIEIAGHQPQSIRLYGLAQTLEIKILCYAYNMKTISAVLPMKYDGLCNSILRRLKAQPAGGCLVENNTFGGIRQKFIGEKSPRRGLHLKSLQKALIHIVHADIHR